MKSLKLAVIGKDVSKSLSPEMHSFISRNMGREASYEKVSVPKEKFDGEILELLKKYDGLNVTIPYKLSVMPYLKIKGDACLFGAVNTVKCGAREGYNTDGAGFALMLENNGVTLSGNKFLVLGAGGAGRSAVKKLSAGGAEVSVFDKCFQRAKELEGQNVRALESLRPENYYCVINATGIGMHGTEGISPVGEEILKGASVAVDLIYTPPKSKFLEIAEGLGKKILNGESMLFYQAYFAECIFFDIQPNAKEAAKLFKLYRAREA